MLVALLTPACSPAPSLPLLLTDLEGRRPRPSLPHHTHHTLQLRLCSLPHRHQTTCTHLLAMIVGPRTSACSPLPFVRPEGSSSAVAPGCVERWEGGVRYITLAVLNHLPASPGDVRRSAHTRMLARSLPSTTSNGSWVSALSPLAPTPHALHTTAPAVLTPTPPPNYLHAPPGDNRRAAHIRMLFGFPSASDQPPVSLPMYICTCTNTR
jgi:hypothetical protein